MKTKFIFIPLLNIVFISANCQSRQPPQKLNTGANSNCNSANSNAAPTPLPPGFSEKPLPLSGTTPGIPDANKQGNLPKTAQATPGIPDIGKIRETAPQVNTAAGIPAANKNNIVANRYYPPVAPAVKTNKK